MNDDTVLSEPATILYAQGGTDSIHQSAPRSSRLHTDAKDGDAMPVVTSSLESRPKDDAEVLRNSEGKLICVFQNQCLDLSFERKREWR
jgi:hypothetical protein